MCQGEGSRREEAARAEAERAAAQAREDAARAVQRRIASAEEQNVGEEPRRPSPPRPAATNVKLRELARRALATDAKELFREAVPAIPLPKPARLDPADRLGTGGAGQRSGQRVVGGCNVSRGQHGSYADTVVVRADQVFCARRGAQYSLRALRATGRRSRRAGVSSGPPSMGLPHQAKTPTTASTTEAIETMAAAAPFRKASAT